MKTYWLKGRTGPIKGIPKKNKITETPPMKKDTKPRGGKANLDPPPARMRTVKEEDPKPKAKPPSPKKEPLKPKPPSPKKEPPKPKPPSPKKEPPKPKPPSPKKETVKSRSPTPKREPPKPKSPLPPKALSPKKQTPTPKELSPPAPTIRVPDKQALPTKQVEPITIAVQPAARGNRIANAKSSPKKETITGKKVYDDGSNIKSVNPKTGDRNGIPSDSPVASEKMNGSKASIGPTAVGELPKGKAQSCTCNIL